MVSAGRSAMGLHRKSLLWDLRAVFDIVFEMDTAQERRIRRYFKISLFLKGIISLGEIVAGVLVLAVPPALLTGWIVSASQDELVEEPGDFIATHSLLLAHQFAVTSGVVIAVYLLSRGFIKLGLVAALWKNWLWAYPASLVVLSLFIVYQAYEMFIGHSLLIAAITVLDLIVVYFIWDEYRIVRRHMKEKTQISLNL
jgi:uncharacterized membrane protein